MPHVLVASFLRFICSDVALPRYVGSDDDGALATLKQVLKRHLPSAAVLDMFDFATFVAVCAGTRALSNSFSFNHAHPWYSSKYYHGLDFHDADGTSHSSFSPFHPHTCSNPLG